MKMNKQKLESTWIGKDQRPRLELRILLEENDPLVQIKAQAAQEYRQRAIQYLQANNGKPWCYVLIPHDEVSEHRSVTDFE